MIGLGLSDEKDITVKGLEAVKSSSKVYLAWDSITEADALAAGKVLKKNIITAFAYKDL